jgi:hypothetical protein
MLAAHVGAWRIGYTRRARNVENAATISNVSWGSRWGMMQESEMMHVRTSCCVERKIPTTETLTETALADDGIVVPPVIVAIHMGTRGSCSSLQVPR